ncbi:TPA: phage holin family protein [Streptococcus suis]
MKPINFMDFIVHYQTIMQDPFLVITLALIGLDVVTGLLKATFLRVLSSSVSLAGWAKHSGVTLLCITIYPALTFLGLEEVGAGIMSLAMVTYAISVAENLSDLNVPIPKFVMIRLDKAKKALEETEE